MTAPLKNAKPATESKNESKALAAAFEIKDADKGEVEAVIATLGVIDRDGDIIQKTAIKSGSPVVVSSYGHDAVYGNRPVGKGVIDIRGDKAVFKGRLFLNTTDGRETFEVLKEMGSDQEWSFGFRVIGYEVPSEDDKKGGAWRVLTKLDAFEVSPVLIGAGIGTQTLAVKQADGDPGAAIAADPPAPVVAETVAAPIVDDVATKALAAETERKAADAKANAIAAETFERFQRTKRQPWAV